jgi:hypothetical protein
VSAPAIPQLELNLQFRFELVEPKAAIRSIVYR